MGKERYTFAAAKDGDVFLGVVWAHNLNVAEVSAHLIVAEYFQLVGPLSDIEQELDGITVCLDEGLVSAYTSHPTSPVA